MSNTETIIYVYNKHYEKETKSDILTCNNFQRGLELQEGFSVFWKKSYLRFPADIGGEGFIFYVTNEDIFLSNKK